MNSNIAMIYSLQAFTREETGGSYEQIGRFYMLKHLSFFKKKINSILVVANFNALHLSGIVALLFQIRKITLYCSSLYVDTNAQSQSHKSEAMCNNPELQLTTAYTVWLITLLLLVLVTEFFCLPLQLPSVSNVQLEPIEVNIDKLDLVLVEKDDSENLSSPTR